MRHPGSVKLVGIDEAREIIRSDVPRRVIRMVVLHHTWRPRAAQYKGEATVKAIREYHVKDRRWSDIGYNWIIGPTGDTWTGRTLQKHGAHCLGHNSDSVGLTMVLDGDIERLDSFPKMRESMLALTLQLLETHQLTPDDVNFHRDFASKSCLGKLVSRDYVRDLLDERLAEASGRQWVRLKINDVPVRNARLVNDDGTVRAAWGHQLFFDDGKPIWIEVGQSVRELLEGLGYCIPPHGWHGEQGPAGTCYAYR